MKHELSIWETAKILNDGEATKFHLLRRWTVLAARRLVRRENLTPEALAIFDDMLESAIESL